VLGRSLKRGVPGAAGARIGEAWEFSCDPAFPSRVVGTGQTLLALVEAFPDAVLSPASHGRCDILVKLLDASAELSLQVHPGDDDPALAPAECGKPESWLVLAAAPGAGIYLGFSRAVAKDTLRAALAGGDARSLLHFEPVKAGDYFEIGPGVPHAIGPGVTLLEPQRVIPGRAGKTFRMWDWNRRYDAAGLPDPRGAARPLHLEDSLRLVDPERQVGAAFTAGLRVAGEVLLAKAGVTVTRFARQAPYQTLTLRSSGEATLSWSIEGGYGALVMLAGSLSTPGGAKLSAGEPALLPASAMPLTSRLSPGTEFAVVMPREAALALHPSSADFR
jgi:mannose-6-phosphate isomerase